MLKLFLWLRYLRKRKIVFLSIAAVVLSTALLIVVASLFTGFINAFERSAVETIGDVVLAAPIRFTKYPLFIERLEQTRAVEAATATLSAPGLLHLGKGNVRAVTIWGVEPANHQKVTGFKQFLIRQKKSSQEPSFQVPGSGTLSGGNSSAKDGGFVGIGVVAEPDEKTDEYDDKAIEKEMVGRQVILTTGTVVETNPESASELDKQFKRKILKFTIADIVFTGVYQFDTEFVYLPIQQLQKTLHPDEEGFSADQIQIKLRPGVDVELALAQIRGLWHVFATEQLGWGTYLIQETDISTAKQLQSRYVVEIRKQMGVLLLIFGVVSFSVVLLIFCIFYMIVMTKQRDIAIIKSCGATSRSVALVFVGFGICVGIVGSGLGAILGYIITKNINAIEEWIRIILGLKLWKSSVYMFSRIPNEVDWGSTLFVVLFAIAAAAIGALIPAVVAARTKPINILRYE